MGDKKPRVRRSNSEASSSSSTSTSSFSSDEEADARDLKPIRGYLSNRRELARQLFKSVKTEKIRMMLPQILKTMNLSDLEEWCASELCGMSEARILSIVNGQPMLESSDTNESDDSGPSLEIISDTEEWLTDTEVPIKEESSSSGAPKSKRVKASKSRSKNSAVKKSESEKTRARAKGKANSGATVESDVRVKKEKEKDGRATGNKEGESLLDLLELEMRARAIRALIRKEEDVIPSSASEKRIALTANALRTLNSAMSASLSSEKTPNGKLDVGESASNNRDDGSVNESGRAAKTVEDADDEDVVFVVVQPTPTIELLSSDNDEEKGDGNNAEKKKQSSAGTCAESANQRQSRSDKSPESAAGRDNAVVASDRIVTIDKSGNGSDNLKIVITKRVSESSGSPSPSKSSKSKKNAAERVDKMAAAGSACAGEKTSEKVAEVEQSAKGLFNKIKRKQHLRSKRKTTTEGSKFDREVAEKSSVDPSAGGNEAQASNSAIEAKPAQSTETEIASSTCVPGAAVVKVEAPESRESLALDSATKIDRRKTKRKSRRRIRLDEDRPDDFEEIIDLDNYSDDMDEMEDNGDSKSTEDEADTARDEPAQVEQRTQPEDSGVTKEQSDSSETWATRYYQTDDVQNVIKESKIQSEIRKRLRERQRQSKLNSSPKLNSPVDATANSDKIEEKAESKPTGSVQEYLALKNASASISDDALCEIACVDENKTNDGQVGDANYENSTARPDEHIVDSISSNSFQTSLTSPVSTETTQVQ